LVDLINLGIPPKILVPINLFCLFIKSTSFLGNLIYSLKFFLNVIALILTTKAFTMSPFFILAVERFDLRIDLIDTVTTSPINA